MFVTTMKIKLLLSKILFLCEFNEMKYPVRHLGTRLSVLMEEWRWIALGPCEDFFNAFSNYIYILT